MVKNQRNSCCHMGCPPMIGDLHFHRGYSLRLQESKPLKNNGIIRYEGNGNTGDARGSCHNGQSSASAPSSLDFGVESFQFHAGVFDTKLPIDAALFGVRLVRPGCNFSLQYGQFTDAAVAETLAREATQFTFGDIEPATVFWSVTEVD